MDAKREQGISPNWFLWSLSQLRGNNSLFQPSSYVRFLPILRICFLKIFEHCCLKFFTHQENSQDIFSLFRYVVIKNFSHSFRFLYFIYSLKVILITDKKKGTPASQIWANVLYGWPKVGVYKESYSVDLARWSIVSRIFLSCMLWQ